MAVDPTNLWKGPQQIDSFLAANPELQPIADQPQAKWINTLSDAQNIPNLVSAASAAGNKTLLLCIYAIPGRDSGNYSAGGFPDRASYLSFLQTVKTNLGNHPTIIAYEPDALGLTPGMTEANRTERIETLRQGVGILSTIPDAEVYIDASKWISITDQANMLQSVDVHLIEGYSLNISGYDSQASCYTYGNDLYSALVARGISGKKYIIDSSRNGVGPLTDADRPLADPWLNTSQAWCNPPKRRTGLVPALVPGQPNCRATLWIKQPGESDGSFPSLAQSSYYGVNAPNAGTFWVPSARDLLGFTPQSGTTPPSTGTVSDVVANFNADWGSFTIRSGGTTLVGGRGRIPVGIGTYENIDTARSYTLLGGSVYARMYPHAAAGATSTSLDFIITSPTAGQRIIARIDPALNELMLAAETGYYDPAQVKLTYDPVAHAWVRIRESGGSVYWETSPDGTTWTQRKTTTRPSWITSTNDASVQFVANRDAGTVNFAEVDNVNVSPVTNYTTSQSDTLAITDTITYQSSNVPGLTVPSGLTVVPAATPAQLDLSWNSVSGVSGYDIERNGVIIVLSHPTTSYSDTGLTVGQTYSYRVRTVF